MMKLDNRGFSFGVMIVVITLFMFFLIVVSLYASNFGIGKNSPEPLYQEYEELEEEDE